MKPIVLIGDWAVDHTVYVKVPRLCPEAPVPVAVPTRETKEPGMAGNVLRNLCSMSGLDEREFVVYRPHTDNIKTRYVDEQTGYIMLRVDRDYSDEVAFDTDCIERGLRNAGASAIVISDYGKGFLNDKIIRTIARLARQHDVPTFLDTKLHLGAWSRDIFCVKINQKEYDGQQKAIPENWCQHLVVTRASEPTWYFSKLDGLQKLPVNKVNVADVCGAGDTMLAALVLKYVRCGHLRTAIEFANDAASIAVSKHGVYAVTKRDLQLNGMSLT